MRLLDYNPLTGELRWRHRDNPKFDGRLAGKVAFTCINAYGYATGRIFNVHYYAHRVIWKILHDEEPPEVDHRNGKRGDNREKNLRSSNRAEQMKNVGKKACNTSGFPGVNFDARRGKWRAYISEGGRQHWLGYHLDIASAANARRTEAIRRGFTIR